MARLPNSESQRSTAFRESHKFVKISFYIHSNQFPPMRAVVLCGGESSRMGSDKGLRIIRKRTWAQTASDIFATLQIPAVFSIAASQYDKYSAIIPSSALVKDNETLGIKGPLCGVVSVHNQYPSEDLFVLACDMPLMESFLLKMLLQAYQDNPGQDAYIFTNDGEYEPLCGIYTNSVLDSVTRKHNGQLTRNSMKFILGQVNVFTIRISETHKKYFRNFNTQEELSGLE